MKASRKTAFLALFLLLSGQLSAGIMPGMMPVDAADSTGSTAESRMQLDVSGHNPVDHMGMHGDMDDDSHSRPTSHEHATADCNEQCSNCVNHCSTIGADSGTSSPFGLDDPLTRIQSRDLLAHKELLFRPPISS